MATPEGFAILSVMRFSLIDQIVDLTPGSRITAVKSLTNAEEYLADHFPGFPVMPGALILEAMTQAAAWLIRCSEDFAHSVVVLDRVEHLRFGRLVDPGRTLTVSAEVFRQGEHATVLKAAGQVDGRTTVNGRLTLRRYNLADSNPELAAKDLAMVEHLRELFALLSRRLTTPT